MLSDTHTHISTHANKCVRVPSLLIYEEKSRQAGHQLYVLSVLQSHQGWTAASWRLIHLTANLITNGDSGLSGRVRPCSLSQVLPHALLTHKHTHTYYYIEPLCREPGNMFPRRLDAELRLIHDCSLLKPKSVLLPSQSHAASNTCGVQVGEVTVGEDDQTNAAGSGLIRVVVWRRSTRLQQTVEQ